MLDRWLVEDASLLYNVLKGAPPGSAAAASSEPSTVKLTVLGGYFMERLGSEVETGIEGGLDALRTAGISMSTATLPHARDVAPVYLHIVLADAAAYHARTLERRPHAYTNNVRLRLEMGRNILAEDYVRAMRGRSVLRREVDRALEGADALVLPALAIEAPPIGAATVPVKGGQESVRNAMLRCTQLFNLTGHPAISLPCATTRSGLPIGLQLVGHSGRTSDLLRVAGVVEQMLSSR